VNVKARVMETIQVRSVKGASMYQLIWFYPWQEGAYADVTVKLGLIKLLQKRFDVCEEACVHDN
jgi:hypothetical protein